MEKFKLSENIDPNKVFIINRSELEGRIDPHFHKKEYNIIREKLSLIPTSSIRNESVKIFSGITPLSGGDAYTDKDNGIPFVRSGDFSEDNIIDFNNLNFIKPEIHNKLMKGSKILRNDLLIAIVGATIGKVGVYNYDFEANINQAICGVRFKENINPHFIHIFFLTDLGQKILDRIKRPVARANINLEEVGSIPIPLLDIITQKKIVSYFYNKIIQKQQKEAEAQRLLDSIDDYLLGELGIALPKEEEHLPQNTDKKNSYNLDNDNPLVKKGRLFLTNLSEVTGKRWNAFEFKNRKLKLGDGNYPNKTLKHLAYLLKGQSITSNEIEKGDYPVIAGGQISPYTHNRYNFNRNVITISASGAYSGYVWYHNHPIFASDCTVVFSKEESEITTLYLSEILKLKQKEIYNLQQGAGQPHVYARDLEKINVPILPIEKQKEITNKITAIREKAKKLQLEAFDTLEIAKREIEQMILGN